MKALGVSAALLVTVALALPAVGVARTPKPAERQALRNAFQAIQGNAAVQSIAVSRADSSYATLHWGYKTALNDTLFHRTSGLWKELWTRDSSKPADGVCLSAPPKVVKELYAVACPSTKALRARAATAAEQGLLRHAFVTSSLTPYGKTATGFSRVCVSRLDGHWAAATATFSEAQTYVWFRHMTSWKVVYETVIGRGSEPPSSIVLSLASCVGYNAAEYGG
ncbi:MAG: hypothetical protein WCH31_05800 [Actinomycetes bacterium]